MGLAKGRGEGCYANAAQTLQQHLSHWFLYVGCLACLVLSLAPLGRDPRPGNYTVTGEQIEAELTVTSRNVSEEVRAWQAWRDPRATCRARRLGGASRELPATAASLPSTSPCSCSQQSSRWTPMLSTMHTKHCSSVPRRDTTEPLLCHSWQREVSLRFACVPEGKWIYHCCSLLQAASS